MWMLAAAEPPREVATLDCVTLFGFVSVFLALVFYLERHRSRAHNIVLASSVAATAVYAFLQGAWPLGILLAAASAKTLWSFEPAEETTLRRKPRFISVELYSDVQDCESRISRMFGSK